MKNFSMNKVLSSIKKKPTFSNGKRRSDAPFAHVSLWSQPFSDYITVEAKANLVCPLILRSEAYLYQQEVEVEAGVEMWTRPRPTRLVMAPRRRQPVVWYATPSFPRNVPAFQKIKC